jgi:hypothetical protein
VSRLLLLLVACGSPSRPTTLAPPDPGPTPPDLSKLATQPITELGVSGEILIYSLEEQPVVAIARDGKTIATGENDRAVHVRSLPDFRELRTIASPDAGLIAGSVAFGPDGALAIGWIPVGDGGTPSAAIYGANGAVVTRFVGTWVYAGQLIWLPDRFVMRGGKPAIWHADGRGPMHELDLPFAKQLAVNAAGTHLVARERRPTYHAHWDEHSRTTNQDPGKLHIALVDSPRIFKTVDFDAAHVAAAGDDFLAANHQWLRRYDRDGNQLASVALGDRPDALVALGDRAIVANSDALAIYRMSDLVPQRTIALTSVVGLWPLPPDRLLILDDKNHLRLVQLAAN